MASRETNNEVAVAADTAAQAEDWPALWALRHRLSETDLWHGSYGPACAIAGWYVDRDAGRTLLDEMIAAGFHQPELFSDEFAVTFATEDDWEDRERQMLSNVPAPPIELLDWPDYAPTLEPVLDQLPADRESLLRDRMPTPVTSAWDTAVSLLDWTSASWQHANGHVDRRDAVEVLERVDLGERFACVEYAIVLSQALNAAGIPARSLNLLMRDHHTGAGRGHVVSEAWIDDLERWVLLDGQNGAWWGDEGEPLGVLDLMERYAVGDRPPMNSHHHHLSDAEQAVWFWYFSAATTTGVSWSDGPYVPTFQTHGVVRSDRLVQGSAHLAPSLSRIATAVVDAEGPALRFSPVHPFATAVQVTPVDSPAGPARRLDLDHALPLAAPAGTHLLDVACVTPYASLTPSALRYVTR